jgi:protoporphyrinogen oxidase
VGDETWLASPETLARRCEATLLESGLIREPAVDSLVAHIPDGYPVYRVGYEKTLRQALDRLRSLKNCITAGRQGLFRHNNIDQALQMGLLAADSIQTRVGDFNRWYDEVSRFNDYRIVD